MKFTPTPEQQAIFDHDGDMKVEAVAGSGKTTTLVHYTKTRHPTSKILYLVFNKSAKVDALNKFRRADVCNVHVQTAHSLAYNAIMTLPKYHLAQSELTSFGLIPLLGIQGDNRYVIAKHVKQCMAIYCNSDYQTIPEVRFFEQFEDEMPEAYGRFIEELCQKWWELMNKAEIEVSHEWYLKRYHLSKPTLKYDYILFDEGQDASPVMLDIFLSQKCKKIIVGDTHQQIYAWRGAVNSLEAVNFKSFPLSNSFRFGPDIARVANSIMNIKGEFESSVTGVGEYKNDRILSQATISRTNICLLKEMVKFVEENPEDHIYYEGNINALLYSEDGVSMYDVLALYRNQKQRIKSKMIKSFDTFALLEKYVGQSGDREVGAMVQLVKEYGSSLPDVMDRIREAICEDREEAEMAFTTTHKAKGLEYDSILLTDDFGKGDEEKVNMTEEVNILYVAITRAKKELLFPDGFTFYKSFYRGEKYEN